jgi:NADH-quinone oxidoreductase subunit N
MLHFINSYLPELVLLTGALALFFVTLGERRSLMARRVALGTALATIAACVLALPAEAILFDGAYRVDGFSQILKLFLALGLFLALLAAGGLQDIPADFRPEFYLFTVLGGFGLVTLVSCVDVLSLVVALQMASFPLYLLVPLRRERAGQRAQMESAAKYIMFGIAANGIMLFGLSYLYGLTGATAVPALMHKLRPVAESPLALAGLALTCCGLFYKLAVFPFHFWTPDVYQGSSNESAAIIATLPKLGAVAVLARLTALASPDNPRFALLLAVLAAASMFYGNLAALVQTDLKRLLGFSGIAHAGYTVVGLVALDRDGRAAALYYLFAYVFMTLACFTVVCRVSYEGRNVAMGELAGLHRRSPLLAWTLLAGVFGLAGVPPLAGFIGKLALLKAALAQGWLWLVVLAVLNSAIAVYYYLLLIREAFFRDAPPEAPVLEMDAATRWLCWLLVVLILALGLFPGRIIALLGMVV